MAPTDRSLLNRILDKLDSHQEQVAVMQSSVAVLVDDRSRAAGESQEVVKQIQRVQDRVETIDRAVAANTVLTANVQQDVAEMKNDAATVKTTLEDYQRNKIIAEVAVGDVSKLKEIVRRFEDAEVRNNEWWKWVKGLGWIGWTIICGVGAGAIGLAFYYLQRFL